MKETTLLDMIKDSNPMEPDIINPKMSNIFKKTQQKELLESINNMITEDSILQFSLLFNEKFLMPDNVYNHDNFVYALYLISKEVISINDLFNNVDELNDDEMANWNTVKDKNFANSNLTKIAYLHSQIDRDIPILVKDRGLFTDKIPTLYSYPAIKYTEDKIINYHDSMCYSSIENIYENLNKINISSISGYSEFTKILGEGNIGADYFVRINDGSAPCEKKIDIMSFILNYKKGFINLMKNDIAVNPGIYSFSFKTINISELTHYGSYNLLNKMLLKTITEDSVLSAQSFLFKCLDEIKKRTIN